MKFRAWDKKEKAIIEVDGIVWRNGKVYDLNVNGSYHDDADDFDIMQFTGLRDKNGVEIYEGDICEFVISEGERKVNPQEALTRIIEIKNLTPGFTPTHPDEHCEEDQSWKPFWCQDEGGFWSSDYFTVIGNIHENSEMLKK